MSDSTAFLGGAAFAGIAVLLLFKGGVSVGTSNQPPPQVLSTVPVAPSGSTTLPPPPSVQTVPPYNFDQQRSDTEQLKSQLEQQRLETEQLKAQLRGQQALIDTLSSQAKTIPPSQVRPVPAADATEQPNHPLVTGLLWALVGMVLTVTGGVAMLMMFVVFSRGQRPSRTVQVIHSMDDNASPYLYPKRRSEFLPPRVENKRVDPTTYDS